MANLKSSKKDLRRSNKRRVFKQSVKSSLKTYIKKVRTAAASGDADTTAQAVVQVQSALDKAARHRVIHKNAAARRKSRAAKAANAALKTS
ncbi:MAG TPA: 30S ribosomal protein S20 [Fimbriimonadaceae bacterium]|nr:30S ribosomal protein S20 [Fimbriimonadaceae bacterium]